MRPLNIILVNTADGGGQWGRLQKGRATGAHRRHRLGLVEGPVDITSGAGEPPTNKARYEDSNREIKWRDCEMAHKNLGTYTSAIRPGGRKEAGRARRRREIPRWPAGSTHGGPQFYRSSGQSWAGFAGPHRKYLRAPLPLPVDGGLRTSSARPL